MVANIKIILLYTCTKTDLQVLHRLFCFKRKCCNCFERLQLIDALKYVTYYYQNLKCAMLPDCTVHVTSFICHFPFHGEHWNAEATTSPSIWMMSLFGDMTKVEKRYLFRCYYAPIWRISSYSVEKFYFQFPFWLVNKILRCSYAKNVQTIDNQSSIWSDTLKCFHLVADYRF